MHVYEFKLKSDFKSPNSGTKNNELVFYTFKKGQTFVGYPLNQKNSNVKSGTFKSKVFVNKDNFLVPLTYLEPQSNIKYNGYDDWLSKRKTVKTDDLPPEVVSKIKEVAEKNYAKNITASMSKNMKFAVLFSLGGVGYAMLAKKNVYLWGIAGLLAGVFYTGFRNSSAEKKLISAKTEKEKEAEAEEKENKESEPEVKK